MRLTLDADERVPDTPETRQRIRQIVEQTGAALGMDRWHLTLRIYSDPDDEDAAAYCSAEPESRTIDLWYNLAHIIPSRLDWTVRHEVIHAAIWPLSYAADSLARTKDAEKWIENVTEQVVDTLADAPVWNGNTGAITANDGMD